MLHCKFSKKRKNFSARGLITTSPLSNCRCHYMYVHVLQGSQKKFVVILRAVCRRQFLEPEAERCGVGKLTMRRILLSFLFFHFPFLRVYFAKKHFGVFVWLDGKKQFALQFLVPSSKKNEKIHEPLSMMVITLTFFQTRKSLVFSRSAAVRQRVHQ